MQLAITQDGGGCLGSLGFPKDEPLKLSLVELRDVLLCIRLPGLSFPGGQKQSWSPEAPRLESIAGTARGFHHDLPLALTRGSSSLQRGCSPAGQLLAEAMKAHLQMLP